MIFGEKITYEGSDVFDSFAHVESWKGHSSTL